MEVILLLEFLTSYTNFINDFYNLKIFTASFIWIMYVKVFNVNIN